VRGTPGIPNFKRRPWGPGWVLVGDAGCTKDPVSGHGISDAMVSAELAARAIHEVLCGADEGAAMRAFHAQRDAFVADTYDTAVEWASYAWTAEEVLDIQLRYGAALTSAAQAVRALPPWAGVPMPETAGSLA
jgi:flavin-dependent dehydrogenase